MGSMEHYEGLVHTTARMLVSGVHPDLKGQVVADDVEDVMQVLRLKVYKALGAFDPAQMECDRYVYMCVRNQAKDIIRDSTRRQRREGVLYIEDLTAKYGDRFLTVSHDDVYAAVEDMPPQLPNTLTLRECMVMVLLYRDYTRAEIASRMGLTVAQVDRSVQKLRVKLAPENRTSVKLAPENRAPTTSKGAARVKRQAVTKRQAAPAGRDGTDRKRAWYERNRETILEERKESYEENRDDVLAERRRYYQRNRKKILAKKKQRDRHKRQQAA